MTEIAIENYYDSCYITNVDLPEGKTADDIEDIWTKWGRILIEFKDGTELEITEDTEDCGDTKRPTITRAFAVDADGMIDFDEEVFCDG